MKTLLLATTNPGKIQEIKAILTVIPLRLLSPAEIDLRLTIDEISSGYFGNARLKAQIYANVSGLPALADDSGPVPYTHLRAHETVLDLVCRLLLEKKKLNNQINSVSLFASLHTT